MLIHEFSAGACQGRGLLMLLAAPRGEMHLQSWSWRSPAPPCLCGPAMGSGDLSQVASLPPGHAHLRSPPRSPSRQGACPHPCPFSCLPQRISRQRASPSRPPWCCSALAFDPRSRRRCRSPGFGDAPGPGRVGAAGVGVLPRRCCLPWVWRQNRGGGRALVVQSEGLPSQPHAREPRPSPHPSPARQPRPGPFFPARSSSVSQIPALSEEMLFGQHLGAGVAI